MPHRYVITLAVLGLVIAGVPRHAAAQVDTLGPSLTTWVAQPTVGQDTATVYLERNGNRQIGMRYIETIARIPEGLLLVQQNIRPDGRIVTLDSVALAAGTLAPLWHADVTPTGRMRVAFGDGRMRGTSTDTAGVAKSVDIPLAAPLLDFSATSTFVRLLPLRAGYTAVVRSYDIHRGVQHTPVRVVGEETITMGAASIPTWKVETTANGRTVTHWIDQRTRRELRVRASMGPAEMIMERMP